MSNSSGDGVAIEIVDDIEANRATEEKIAKYAVECEYATSGEATR